MVVFSRLQSYRYFPVNLDVISWLGVWYVKSELYEKAIEFFERASEIQPNEVSICRSRIDGSVCAWLAQLGVNVCSRVTTSVGVPALCAFVTAQVKWRLMVTSCYRRMGSFQKAMELYEAIHLKYPENLECECLKAPFLVRVAAECASAARCMCSLDLP